ncbi:unnamed protein product [Malus baccata var. baccata]
MKIREIVSGRIFDPAKNNRLLLRKSFRACLSKGPVVIPNIDLGCLELMSRSGISIKGKKAVIVGRSNIVGLPVSLLLLKADATVNVVHSRTPDPESTAVIVVSTNAIDNPSRKSGYRLVAGWVTLVPGGVEPMTVAMLLKNTLDGAKHDIAQ